MGTEPLGIGVLIFETAVGTADGTAEDGGGGGARGTDPLFETAVLEGTGFLAGALFFEFS